MGETDILVKLAESVGNLQGSLDSVHRRIDEISKDIDDKIKPLSDSVHAIHQRVDRMGPVNGIIRLWNEARPVAIAAILALSTWLGVSVDSLISAWRGDVSSTAEASSTKEP